MAGPGDFIPLIGGIVSSIGKVATGASAKSPRPYTVNRTYFDDREGDAYEQDMQRMAGLIAQRDIDRQRYEQSRGLGLDSRDMALQEMAGYGQRIGEQAAQSRELARQQAYSLAGSAPMSQQAQALRSANRGYTGAAQQIAADAARQRWAQHQAAIAGLGTMRGQDLGMAGNDLGDEAQRQQYEIDKARTRQQYVDMAARRSEYGATLGARGEQLQSGVMRQAAALPVTPDPGLGFAQGAANFVGSMGMYGFASRQGQRRPPKGPGYGY